MCISTHKNHRDILQINNMIDLLITKKYWVFMLLMFIFGNFLGTLPVSLAIRTIAKLISYKNRNKISNENDDQ